MAIKISARHTFCTCKAKGINPCEWLVDTLNKIPSHLINRIHELFTGYKQKNNVLLLGRLLTLSRIYKSPPKIFQLKTRSQPGFWIFAIQPARMKAWVPLRCIPVFFVGWMAGFCWSKQEERTCHPKWKARQPTAHGGLFVPETHSPGCLTLHRNTQLKFTRI